MVRMMVPALLFFEFKVCWGNVGRERLCLGCLFWKFGVWMSNGWRGNLCLGCYFESLGVL